MNLNNWLALIRTPQLGSKTARALLTTTTIDELFNASRATLSNLGLKSTTIEAILNPQWQLIKQDLQWLEDPNHHLITYDHSAFPPLLKEIPDPPIAIYIAGNPELLWQPQLAMVGSRNPSPSGRDTTHEFAKYLAQTGLTITSGFATGIDAAAHFGALAAKGNTIAVMGTGLDTIYPKQNHRLAEEILQNNGALISEFPIGTPTKANNFPIRNRIVSGLSLGTLVIEATLRSGSLITARLASEQGREVFAIPGSIHNPLARGCHQLIRQGAKLVETAQDIIEELGPLAASLTPQSPTIPETTTNGNTTSTLDPDYKKLLEYIGYEATPIDLLVSKSGFSTNNISSMLLILELQGHITTVPGGYAKMKRKVCE